MLKAKNKKGQEPKKDKNQKRTRTKKGQEPKKNQKQKRTRSEKGKDLSKYTRTKKHLPTLASWVLTSWKSAAPKIL